MKLKSGYQQSWTEDPGGAQVGLCDTFRSTLRNQIAASSANGAVVNQKINELSTDLGGLNV
jgi:hypothetical protein